MMMNENKYVYDELEDLKKEVTEIKETLELILVNLMSQNSDLYD